MKSKAMDESDIQRKYYASTAHKYNAMHGEDEQAIMFSMHAMFGMLPYLNANSVLDIGSGTGRTILFAKKNHPDIVVKGIEPVQELREVAYGQGISSDDLIDGDALALPFADGSFDVVCEFAVLHHIRNPELAVKEMLRVARKGIFISDSNNFGQGGYLNRGIKQLLNTFGLWPIANYLKTKGHGYIITDGDGLSYSYSVFNDYEQIRRSCKSVHVFNTSPSNSNIYRTAGSVALLGIKN